MHAGGNLLSQADKDTWEAAIGAADDLLLPYGPDDTTFFDALADANLSGDAGLGGGGAAEGATTWRGGGGHARCLDASHPRGCARCISPPPLGEEHTHRLTGDPQKKNGEKKARALLAASALPPIIRSRFRSSPPRCAAQVRALLAACAEWRSQSAREVAAVRAEQQLDGGDGALLAAALRRRDTSLLRKRHLLWLAREWQRRSDLWVCKRGRPPPRAAADAAAAATAAAAAAATAATAAQQRHLHSALPPGGQLVLCAALHRGDALRCYADVELRQLHVRAAALTAAVGAAPAIESHAAHALVTPFALTEWRGVFVVNAQFTALATAGLGGVRAMRAALLLPRSDDDPSTAHASATTVNAAHADDPAFSALHGALSPVEALLDVLREAYGKVQHLIAARSAARWAARTPSNVERLYFDEPYQCALLSLELVTRCTLLLAQLRCGTLGAYLDGAEVVARAVGDAVNAQADAQRARIDWLQRVLDGAPERARARARRRGARAAALAAATEATAANSVDDNFPELEAAAASVLRVTWEEHAGRYAQAVQALRDPPLAVVTERRA
jgi:hypothetical protein